MNLTARLPACLVLLAAATTCLPALPTETRSVIVLWSCLLLAVLFSVGPTVAADADASTTAIAYSP